MVVQPYKTVDNLICFLENVVVNYAFSWNFFLLHLTNVFVFLTHATVISLHIKDKVYPNILKSTRIDMRYFNCSK